MRIDQSLFESEHICFGPIDHEKDPEIESLWTHDASYLRLISLDPALPASPAQIKKRYEAIEKEQDEDKNLFYFALRMRSDDRLIGFARLFWIEWSNGAGFVQLGAIVMPSLMALGTDSAMLATALVSASTVAASDSTVKLDFSLGSMW